MITAEFAFHAPRRLDEAFELLAANSGSFVKLLAGGMSLVPTMNLGLARPEVVISLNHVEGLAGIREDGGALRIGAMTRHHDVVTSPLVTSRVPLLAETAGYIGDRQVRHRGTIGGSLVHADPAADYLATLAVLDARVVLRRAGGERTVAVRDFVVDILTTAVEPDEIATEIVVPIPASGSGAAYLRLARVEGSFAIVTASALVAPGAADARVAIGGVGGRPVLLELGGLLAGGATAEALAEVTARAEAAASDAQGDLNASPEYRRAMAGVYARRAVAAAHARLG